MDIIEKARELGIMMGNSKEMVLYKKYEAVMQSDEKSNKLMLEYKQLQIDMVKCTREGAAAEIIEETKQKLLAKQQEINEYEITYNYLTAKANLEALMKKVNDVIVFSITGEPTCSEDKCSSCGGGCRG